jgi:hypothetical protein
VADHLIRRPMLDRDSPRRTNGNAGNQPAHQSLLTDVFQVPPSLLHDPSPNQLHAGARGERIPARILLDLGHQSVPIQKFLCTLSVNVESTPAEALDGRQNVVR